ncbi:DUF6221 family protein [Streptomyces sp. ST2-7A]|uniref:DUF6221 family protein n=1 Tax=Streptomyces sp. ST2-7A TaxID=2907214 RepID=UPI001F45AB37|nr:DUF6221 family protein [Streptomyces sp. ST2-7A]MCE7081420.1 DUF6221 family protein [Streptomyces sp. ST2-7A]
MTARRGEPKLFEVLPVAELAGNGAGGFRTAGDARHAAHHDPGRALRRVEAMGSVLAMCEESVWDAASPELVVRSAARAALGVLRLVLVALAAERSDHPDHREEWTP